MEPWRTPLHAVGTQAAAEHAGWFVWDWLLACVYGKLALMSPDPLLPYFVNLIAMVHLKTWTSGSGSLPAALSVDSGW